MGAVLHFILLLQDPGRAILPMTLLFCISLGFCLSVFGGRILVCTQDQT